MLSRSRYDNAVPEGFGAMEVVDREGVWFIPLQGTELEGTIGGPVAELTLTQVFRFSRERMPRTVEALYRFPLPGDAAITKMVVRFGDVEIVSEIKERGKAEEEYRLAMRDGRRSTLLTRESPDVFTLKVAGIGPDQKVTVSTSYVQLGEPEGVGFGFRVPLTTAPRYVRAQESGSRHVKGQPLASLRDPGHVFSMRLLCVGGRITSRTHELQTDRKGEIRLAEGEVVPDRDCLLLWQPDQARDRFTTITYLEDAPEPVFLSLVTPPMETASRKAREVIILLDRSGSMAGAKWEAANWAVRRFLRSLGPEDRFNLGLFHNDTRWLAPAPVPGNKAMVERAIGLLDVTESGGTELGNALHEALAQPGEEGPFARHVLIITDAEVSDSGRILDMVRKESTKRERRRCSVVCIDSAPNSYLANRMAELGGGVARFLTSDPEEGDITTALDSLMGLWDAPLAEELHLVTNRSPIMPNGKRMEGGYQLPLDDLIAGRSTWIMGMLSAGRGKPKIGLNVGDNEIRTVGMGPVRALLAVRRINALEMLLRHQSSPVQSFRELKDLGYGVKDWERIERRLSEGDKGTGLDDLIRELIVEESLRSGVASSETAFLATRSEKGEKAVASVVVPNALPHGWDGSLISMKLNVKIPMMASKEMDDIKFRAIGDAYACKMIPERRGSVIPVNKEWIIFDGVPNFVDSAAILCDDVYRGPSRSTFHRLLVTIDRDMPKASKICLAIYIGDLTTPRVKVMLQDILDNHGWRPIFIDLKLGHAVRVVLEDPSNEWRRDVEISVKLQ